MDKNPDIADVAAVWGYASAVTYLLALVARVIGGI